MHLDEELVQRLLHGESSPGAEMAVRDHLAQCEECRSRLADAEREERWVLERLRRVDRAPPRVLPEAIMSRGRRRAGGWGRLAAGIVLALAAAGAAYAAPGSPVPGVLRRMAEWVGGSSRPPIRAAPPVATRGGQAGIAVAPGDRLTIAFAVEQPGGAATVSLTDGSDVTVRALGGRTTFTSEVDRLSIEHRGAPGQF
ncbi:MAG: zf-HC2 domain-containing protein, partial [Gemmatimonadales bacterium]